MAENHDLNEQVSVTFTVGEWAKIITSIATSRFDLGVKEYLNSSIYECVSQKQRALS